MHIDYPQGKGMGHVVSDIPWVNERKKERKETTSFTLTIVIYHLELYIITNIY
jgi:hypothetical protein